MGRPKSDLYSAIGKGITDEVIALHGTDDDVSSILKNHKLRRDIARLIIAARPGATSEPVKPARPPLVGYVVKTIIIPPYEASSFAEAVRLGQFDNDTADIVRQFAEERVGLTMPTKVDLVEFDRDWWMDEALAWGIENGGKKPIETAHTMGIAIGFPNEQRERPIGAGGSVRRGHVLYLGGGSGWRDLRRHTVEGLWHRHCLCGFLSE